MVILSNPLGVVTVVFIILFYCISIPLIISGFRIKSSLRGMIKDKSDLEILVSYIAKNKIFAGILILSLFTYILLLVLLSYFNSVPIPFSFSYLRIFSYYTLPIWFLSIYIEKPLKKMKFKSDSFELEEKYRMILIDWAKPGFKLKTNFKGL